MLLYPSLTTTSSTTKLNEAKFNDVRLLYEREQHFTIKQAHKLILKYVGPQT